MRLREELSSDDIEDLRENTLPPLVDRMWSNLERLGVVPEPLMLEQRDLLKELELLLVGGPLHRDGATQLIAMRPGSLMSAQLQHIGLVRSSRTFVAALHGLLDKQAAASDALRAVAKQVHAASIYNARAA